MIPPETASIRPEAKPGKATAKTRAACARIDQAERTRREQALIDKWIRDRLVDWRDSCWRCRRPIVPGQLWTAVSNGEAVARFHQPCHAEWLVRSKSPPVERGARPKSPFEPGGQELCAMPAH